jgi:hypothetical protein
VSSIPTHAGCTRYNNTTLCDKVTCGRSVVFSGYSGPPPHSTDCHDIAQIYLKLELSTTNYSYYLIISQNEIKFKLSWLILGIVFYQLFQKTWYIQKRNGSHLLSVILCLCIWSYCHVFVPDHIVMSLYLILFSCLCIWSYCHVFASGPIVMSLYLILLSCLWTIKYI